MINMNMLRKKDPFKYSENPSSLGDPTDDSTDDSPDETDTSELDTSEPDVADETDTTEPDADADDETTTVSPPPAASQPGSKFGQIYNQAVNTSPGPLSQKLSEYLNRPVPSSDQYKPGKIDRLAAILGGASEGWKRGAGAGINTARKILDDPYQEAMQRYTLEGKNLEAGANLESKNLGRAASFARTATNQDIAANKNEVDRMKVVAQDRHWSASDANTARNAALKGWTHYINSTDGHMIFSKPKADGTLETLDGGKAGDSIPEKTARELQLYSEKEKVRGKTQEGIEGLAQKGRLQLEGARQAGRTALEGTKQANRVVSIEERQKGRMQIQEFKNDNKGFKLFETKGGNIIGIDPNDPTNVVDSGVSTGTLTEADKLKLGVAGKKELQDNAGKTTTTLTDASGKVTGTKTTTKDKSSGMVELTDKAGKKWKVKPEDVEAFKKANQ